MRLRNARILAALAAGALAAAGCGSSSSSSSSSATSTRTAASATSSTAAAHPALDELAAAENPGAAQFPPAQGRTLKQLAALAKSSAQLGAATGTFTPGTRRLAFGLTTSSGAFIYAPTAIYIARSPPAPVQGPFLAPADPMGVAAQYRSKQNAGPGGIQAIYAAQIPVAHAGTYTILSLTRSPSGLVGAPGEGAAGARPTLPPTPPPRSTATRRC